MRSKRRDEVLLSKKKRKEKNMQTLIISALMKDKCMPPILTLMQSLTNRFFFFAHLETITKNNTKDQDGCQGHIINKEKRISNMQSVYRCKSGFGATLKNV